MEAAEGFEPPVADLQSDALVLLAMPPGASCLAAGRSVERRGIAEAVRIVRGPLAIQADVGRFLDQVLEAIQRLVGGNKLAEVLIVTGAASSHVHSFR